MTQIRSTLLRALLGAAALPMAAGAQSAQLPFSPGEQCVYRGSNALGRIGTGTMAVEGGAAGSYLLRFDFRGRVGIFRVVDQTRSWFDPRGMASSRYTKHERSPISSRDEDVQMDRGSGRWRSAAANGAMATDSPLDELSFIYYIRSLRLAEGDRYDLNRHYDARRNPVTVRVIGRGPITVPAGRFQTIEVEMRVRDPQRYQGDGVIQFHFTDDARRIPVRIESAIPRAGRMVLSLEAGNAACGIAPSPAG